MNSTMKEFNQLIGLIYNAYHDFATACGMSDADFLVLYTLLAHDGACGQSVLYHETGEPKSTINTSVKRLQRQGVLLVTRQDRRSTLVSLTTDGQGYAERTAGVLIAAEDQFYSSIPAEDAALFLRVNRQYLAALLGSVRSIQNGAGSKGSSAAN